VRSQDCLLAASLERIRDAARDMSGDDFAAAYGDTAFVLESTTEDAQIIELCPLGSSKQLTQSNAEEYISLYLRAYTQLDELQFKTLYRAFEDVATRKVLAVTTP